MSETTFTIADMIRATRDESPSEFQAAFNQLIVGKVADAVEAERITVAQTYFGDEVQDDTPTQAAEIEDATDENAETSN
jgi:hypothetical protein